SVWDAVIAAAEKYPNVKIVCIVNPSSGPGQSIDANYVRYIALLRKARVTVMGYVATSYGGQPVSIVSNVIATWNKFYTIDGIFFDEMSSVSGHEQYYKDLSAYTRKLGYSITIGNPGTTPSQSYVDSVDVIVTYESAGVPSTSLFSDWKKSYPNTKFAVLAYDIKSLQQTDISEIAKHARYFYFTSDSLPNPWDSIPTYLQKMVSSVTA
ncbi:hypothetical protein HDU93_000917, partial [Gonapodya sp. JEL0774]